MEQAHREEEEWLTLLEAAAVVGLHPGHLGHCVRIGQLKAERRHRPTPGTPPYMVRRADLEAFAATRGTPAPLPRRLPAPLRELVVPLRWAARLVRRSPQYLHKAIRAGKLRAIRLCQPTGKPFWNVRLGDLEAWLEQPDPRYAHARWGRRGFDPERLEEFVALARENGAPS